MIHGVVETAVLNQIVSRQTAPPNPTFDPFPLRLKACGKPSMKQSPFPVIVRTRKHVAALLTLTVLLAGCSSDMYLADTPNLYTAAGAADPFERVHEAWRTNQVRVLYATDRVAQPTEDGKRAFGYQRSMALEVGYVTVGMGENLGWDQLVAASRTGNRQIDIVTKVTDVTMLGQFPESNHPPVLVNGRVGDPPDVVKGNAEAAAQVHASLKEFMAPATRKEIFLYVHGYNNTFEEAAIRMATLWHFLGRDGVPVVYSWPAGSGGVLRGYNRDRESGEFSIFHLKQFLKTLADSPDVQKIHIISHSRGTDVMITTLRELNLEFKDTPLGTRARMKIGQVVLAAPDLDWEVFNQRVLAERVGAVPENLTVYVSKNDKALSLADWLFQGGQRLGNLMGSNVKSDWQDTLKRLPGSAVVDVKAKTRGLGHAYFIDSPEALSDLILVLRDGRQPGAEHDRPLLRREDGFWQIDDGYPNVTSKAQ